MTPRDWHVNSDDILDDLEGCYTPAELRTLALDLAECGQEVHELRREVAHLRAVLAQRKEKP